MAEPMREDLDLHFVEDNHSPGRIFFQIQSGNPFNQCHIESFGSLCIVHGKLVVRPENSSTRRVTTIPFECAFDSGLHISRKELFHDIPHEKVPTYLEARSLTIIKSTQFPPSCPVESITVEALSGLFYTDDLNEYISRSKSIAVFQAAIKFKSYNTIYPEIQGSKERWIVEEVLFDYMTLFNAKVILPRGFKRRKTNNSSFSNGRDSFYDARLGHSPPPVAVVHRRESLTAAIARALLRRRLLLEIFTLFFTIAIWFVLFPKSFAARFWVLSTWNHNVWATLGVLLTIVVFLRWKYPTNNDGNMVTANHVPFNGRSFFVNGWQSWSFCGSILHGEKPPIYSMPSLFVRSFHDGGEGTALRINLGEGRIPFKVVSSPTLPYRSRKDHQQDGSRGLSSPVTPGSIKRHLFDADLNATSSSSTTTPRLSKAEIEANKDYIASDMFTLLSDLRSQYGVMMGFVSQRQQFGCIATNRHYDRLTVHVSGDGVLIPDAGAADNSNLLTTDPLMIYVTNTLENPFLSYMQMSNKANQVDALFAAPSLSTPPSSLSDRSFSFPIPASFSHTNNSHGNASNGVASSAASTSSSTGRHTRLSPSAHSDGGASSDDGFPLDRIPVGWCSWYHFYEKISETILLNNLQRMKQHQDTNHLGSKRAGFQLFQIDDGYQRYWGDWLDIHPRYTSSRSLQTTVAQLQQGGFLSGLWLAPFAADKQATIVRQSPDWILRQQRPQSSAPQGHPPRSIHAKPCNSANCGKFFYGLDVTHPAYQTYLTHCLQTVTQDWGFRYLKLDFLYAAVLPQSQHSLYQRTLTKAQVMQVGMHTIRNSLHPTTAGSPDASSASSAPSSSSSSSSSVSSPPPVFLLGCGAPLGSVIGHVHANRISADMGLTWNPSFPLPAHDTWNLPCARNAVRNTLTRMFMHRHWWINDPDCLMLRDTLSFTEAEMIGVATVKALSGGSLLLSDDFDQVSSRRMRILQKLLPPTDQAAVAVDIAYRETPELLRLVLQSTYSRRMQHWLRANSGSYSSGGGLMSRGTSEAFHDADYHFHVAMSPSNDEFFPWDAGMTTNLYECFQHRDTSSGGGSGGYPPGQSMGGGPRSRANSFGGVGGDGGVGGGIGGWGTEESCDSSSPDESGGDSPGNRPLARKQPLLGTFSPPLGHSPGAPSGAKSLSSSQPGVPPASASAKHSPFLISAHKHNATKDVMTQIRSKYLDKRDLLKRWYVFAACFWTEHTDVKTGEQMAASMDITLSHEQFYQDVSPAQRRRAMAAAATAGGGFTYTTGGGGSGSGTDEDFHWPPSSSATSSAGSASAMRATGDTTSKSILINVQSSRAVRLSQQKRRRQEYFAQYLSNSAFYDRAHHPSTPSTSSTLSLVRERLQRLMSSSSSSSLPGGAGGAAKVQPLKTHFVHVRDIFGAEDLQEMIAYTKYLYRHQLKRRERHIEKSYQNIRMTLSSNDELWAHQHPSQQHPYPGHSSQQKGARATALMGALSVDAQDEGRGRRGSEDFLGPTLQVDSFDQRHDEDHDNDVEDEEDGGEGDDGLGTLPPPSLFDTPPMNRHRRKSMGTSLFGPDDDHHQRDHPRGPLFTPPGATKPSQSLPSSVASGGTPGGISGLPPPITPQTPHTLHLGISHVVHLLNFWEEEYAYKVVTLDDEEGGGEVAFTDIPLHSASLYAMHVSLHPLIPKYLGSNLHFTSGLEVKQAYLMDAPIEMKRALEAMSYAATSTSKRKSRSNVFASPTSSSIFQPHPTTHGHGTKASSQQLSLQPAWHQSFSSSSDSDAGGSSAGNSFSGMVGGVLHLTGASNSFGGKLLDGGGGGASGGVGGGVLHSHTPKIQCMRVDFEDGVLKDASWGGHVWVFLPVNIHATRHYPHLLGRLQVMGDAVHHLTPNDLSPSVPRTKSTTTTDGAAGQDPTATATAAAAMVPDEIEIVEYIDEISCLTAGYVYKIPVSLPPTVTSSTAYNIPGGSSNSNSHSNGGHGIGSGGLSGRADTATAATHNPQLPPKAPLKLEVPPPPKAAHHLIIAWIYDVIENK